MAKDLSSHEVFDDFQVTECVMLKRKLQLPCPRGLHHQVFVGNRYKITHEVVGKIR